VSLAEMAEGFFSLAEEERKFWGVHEVGSEKVIRAVWSEIVWEEISDSPIELLRASKIMTFMRTQEIFPSDISDQLQEMAEQHALLSLNKFVREQISDPSFFIEEAVRLDMDHLWFDRFVDAMTEYLGRANLDKVSIVNLWSNSQLPMRRAAQATQAVHRVAAMIDIVMSEIISDISNEILTKHNLLEKIFHIHRGLPLDDALSLSLSLRSFSAALVAGHSLATNKAVDRLNSKERRSEARQAIAASLLEAYELIYRHAQRLGVAEYTVEEVRMLLQQ
jgi:hypothetical protein